MKSVQISVRAATILPLIVILSCISSADQELNLSFHFDRNQLVVDQLEIDGRSGRFVIGTAYPETLVDAAFLAERGLSVAPTIPITFRGTYRDDYKVGSADLEGAMDAIIGADLLSPVVVIDYSNRIATRLSQTPPAIPGRTVRWESVPRYPLKVGGEWVVGIIDTAVPDSLIVPEPLLGNPDCERCKIDVEIAGLRLDRLPVRVADVEELRIGNRVLRNFLVTIDYRSRTATLERR